VGLSSDRLRVLALRLEALGELLPDDPAEREPNRFPRDPEKTVDENVPMNPHDYPSLIVDHMGGPKRKRHRPHQYEGPRGIAEVEDDEE
jgi:hypothetical protein